MGGSTRRARILRLSVALALVVLTACTGTTTDPTTLQLDEGEVETSFEFEAEDPTTHTLDVEIEMPAGTDLEITFVTTDGTTLFIFDPSRTDTWCDEASGQLRCLLPFPILEARAPGTWTAYVRKLSTPPADLSISVQWQPIEQNR